MSNAWTPHRIRGFGGTLLLLSGYNSETVCRESLWAASAAAATFEEHYRQDLVEASRGLAKPSGNPTLDRCRELRDRAFFFGFRSSLKLQGYVNSTNGDWSERSFAKSSTSSSPAPLSRHQTVSLSDDFPDPDNAPDRHYLGAASRTLPGFSTRSPGALRGPARSTSPGSSNGESDIPPGATSIGSTTTRTMTMDRPPFQNEGAAADSCYGGCTAPAGLMAGEHRAMAHRSHPPLHPNPRRYVDGIPVTDPLASDGGPSRNILPREASGTLTGPLDSTRSVGSSKGPNTTTTPRNRDSENSGPVASEVLVRLEHRRNPPLSTDLMGRRVPYEHRLYDSSTYQLSPPRATLKGPARKTHDAFLIPVTTVRGGLSRDVLPLTAERGRVRGGNRASLAGYVTSGRGNSSHPPPVITERVGPMYPAGTSSPGTQSSRQATDVSVASLQQQTVRSSNRVTVPWSPPTRSLNPTLHMARLAAELPSSAASPLPASLDWTRYVSSVSSSSPPSCDLPPKKRARLSRW